MARRLASLLIAIEGNNAKLTLDMNHAVGIVERGARKMQATTNILKRTLLTIVSVDAFRRAAGAALEFEQSLSRMVGLSGIAASEIDGLRSAVLRLAPAVAKGPNELAEALFFITSSGFKGQEALKVLEVSAKAATAGLGSTVTVADAVTSAINSYGKAHLTAADAVDVLVATVREGKAEADSIAGVLGRVAPLGAQLGVGLEQLGGGLAFLTRATGSAETASTQLAGILLKLIKPSRQAGEALDLVSETSEGLRQSVKEKGLLQALVELRAKLGSNSEALAKIFYDAQALTGVLQLTGVQADEAAQAFASVADRAGSLGTAVEAAADNGLTKLASAQATLNVAMLEFNEQILPTMIDLLVGATKGFSALVFAFGGGRDKILEISDALVTADNKLAQLKKTRDGFSASTRLGDISIGGGLIHFGNIDKQIAELEKKRAELKKQLDAIDKAAVDSLGLGGTDSADADNKRKQAAAAVAEADALIAKAKAKAKADAAAEAAAKSAARASASAAKSAAAAAAQAENQRLASIKSIVDALAEENFALGRSTEEVLRNNLAKLNAPPADVDRAVQLLRENEAYKANTDAIEKYNAELKKLRDEGAAVAESVKTPSENLNAELVRLARLRELGQLSADAAKNEEIYARAVANAWKAASDATDAAKDKMSEFAIEAAHNIQNALGDQLFNVLQGNFQSIGDQFKATLDRMVANAIAAQIADKLGLEDFLKGAIGGGAKSSLEAGAEQAAATAAAATLSTSGVTIGAAITSGATTAAGILNAAGSVLSSSTIAGGTALSGSATAGGLSITTSSLTAAASLTSGGAAAASAMVAGATSAAAILAAAGSAGGGASLVSGLFAKGGAFKGGNVIPFASGGVVSSKTVFPMANGMGLMGEAGPEAIMPLKRLPNGALGVQASGGMGGVTININISGVTDARGIREAAGNAAARAGSAVQSAMARNG